MRHSNQFMRQTIFLAIFSLFISGCRKPETKIDKAEFKDKIQQQFYVDDVDVVEFVTLNYCIDKNGKTKQVTVVPEKTSYKNSENIKAIVKYRKNIIQLPDSKLRNNCYDYTFNFVNKKYQNIHLDVNKYSNCERFKQGIFKYKSLVYPNTTIERTKDFQIERDDKWFAKYKIEWETPTKYILTYLEVSDEQSKYLLGEKIYVEIIDILENGDYVYKSNLLNRTFNFGVISKKE